MAGSQEGRKRKRPRSLEEPTDAGVRACGAARDKGRQASSTPAKRPRPAVPRRSSTPPEGEEGEDLDHNS